jgi:hypothetical protein
MLFVRSWQQRLTESLDYDETAEDADKVFARLRSSDASTPATSSYWKERVQ